MKGHMTGWGISFIMFGVFLLIGAIASLVLVRIATAIVLVFAALGMFMMSSVCAWMDEMLEVTAKSRWLQEDILAKLSQSQRRQDDTAPERTAARRRRAEPQPEEPQENELAAAYRRAMEEN